MEQAAKMRQDEIQKEKELRLLQLRKDHIPIERMDLAKFQDKIDRQIAEAQDRRRFDRLGGQALRDIHLHDISRYELPKTVSRNAKASLNSNSSKGDKRQFDLHKSKKYGDIALRLFKAENAFKKN